ncbi:hypothetical protein K469DRAFT_562812 [Zopfia rhizophila CBS 207.26]|uniref:RING-type domain-containing protein n=1 Tax=Zopfia rhizophila CBS 207.26 TaxID=1314779 RepID=A0A6A6EC60_9PEZI|nr:hypothetical protein K469DRAFT_562812 [Zopfia rhizophila CBS 207.26]
MIDLTGLEDIPDVDVPPNGEQPLRPAEDVQIISEAECLQMVLNVLPDIAVDYVLNLIQDRANDLARTIAEAERLIAFILDEGTYPKERDKVNNRKRKRSDDDDIAEFERGHQEHDNRIYFEHAKTLLKDEFREVPVKHIENTLRNDNTLFKAFNTLDRQLKNYNSRSTPFPKVRARRNNPNAMSSARSQPSNELLRELAAARKKRANDDAKRRKEEYAKRAEEENLQRAQRDNDMTQCLCCFEEYPSNRVTVCNGDIVHFFCLGCAKQYVEHEMGESRCRPVCFATVECKATFTRQQLQAFLDAKSFERLERLQQQEDIRNAGLEDLAECPFCDFKAECPPVEIDKEFRCLNPECGKTSCRLCDKETHIPMSCEEAEKESKVTVRHTLEEAMSKALIRFCNKCKHPFIKEYGCNKMTCTNCRNTQCYICSKDVSGYDHFSDNSHPNRCPLHDNVEARHEEEVKKAEAVALALLRAEHPDISEEELKIQVSDRVKQEEDARRQRAQANHQGFPFQIVGNNLVHRDPNAQPQPVGLQQLHPPIAPGPPPPLAVYFGPGIQPHQAAPAYGNLQPFHNRRINNRYVPVRGGYGRIIPNPE